MTTQTEKPRSGTFVTCLFPWLLGAGLFAVFLATLDRWVTPNPMNPQSVNEFTDLAGWSRGSHVFGPVTFLVTYPLRWLPVNVIPLMMSLFSAICASLCLTLLARSIAILPHDRTHEQRQREQSEFSFLSIRTAWAPPLFAVLLCGLQMTFWENAIQASEEMFDLLLFAYVIRSLLEYRISQKESWLTRCALVYGLGLANNWAMIGFSPAFLLALVWIKGLDFFNVRFLLRTAGCGLIGLSLFLLFPVINSFTYDSHQSAWEMVRKILSTDKSILKFYPRDVVLLLSLTSILPVFVMGIRWASYFGDNSPLGIFLATSIFHIVHALFLVACVWVALDAPISPRNAGLGLPFLTFYYLGALSVGYYSGYFLLVFGGRVPKYQRSLNPLLRTINLCVTACVWALIICAPLILVRKNWANIQAAKIVARGYEDYVAQIEKLLPSQGAVVLSDDNFRLSYLHAALVRDTKSTPHLLIDTGQLVRDPDYLQFLKEQNPHYEIPPPPAKSTNAIASIALIQFVDALGASHELYYLNASFGFFFERFYEEPHGLVYRLRTYPTNAWDMPQATREQIDFNQSYWKKTHDDVLLPLRAILNKPQFNTNSDAWERILKAAHLKRERDWLALPLGAYYAHSLNYWGVELQRAGMRDDAKKCFDDSEELNPANVSVRINVAFNQNLREGKNRVIQLPREMQERVAQPNFWQEVLSSDGPIDEPNFRENLAAVLAKAGEYRQSIQQLDRIRELAPDEPRVALQLAQLLAYIESAPNELSVFLPDYTNAYSGVVINADAVLRRLPDDPTALFLKGVALIQLKEYAQALPPLDLLLSQQATNYTAMLNRAIANFQLGNLDAAKPDYEAVGKVAPNAFQVYYGLASIADQKKDVPTAIKNYELYLTNAPPNSAEAAKVSARLKELKNGPP